MGADMHVSVIIPTYNYGHFIREAVESVQRQTFSDLEIIVVDDGSTDGTQEVLARIGDPRLKVVRTANRGISAARNEGLDRAKGKYIAFLDADDRWRHEKLERQLRIMEAESTVVAVFCNFVRFDGKNAFRAEDQFVYYPELSTTPSAPTAGGCLLTADPFTTFITWNEFPTWVQATLFRASMVSDLRFADAQTEDGRMIFAEDGHYCFRAYRRGRVAYVTAPLVEVRRHETNITKRTRALEARRVVHVEMRAEMLRRLIDEPLTPEQTAALRKRLYTSLSRLAVFRVRQGRPIEAAKMYSSAVLNRLLAGL